MIKKRQVLKIVVGAVVVLTVAQLLNSSLSISSFEKLYRSSLIAKYQIVANDLTRKIETAINLGKPLENFHGMDRLLQTIMDLEPTLENILVTLPNGMILYNTNEALLQTPIQISPLPDFSLKPDDSTMETRESSVIRQDQWYYVVLPLHYQNKEWVGNLYIQFNKQVINHQIYQMISEGGKYLGIVLGIAGLLLPLLLLLVYWVDARNSEDRPRKISLRTKSFVAIVVVLIISQIVYTFLNTRYFSQRYMNMVQTNISTLAYLVKDNIDNLLKIGLSIDRLKKVEVLLWDIVRNVPECQEIKIVNPEGELRYFANQKNVASILDTGFIPEHLDLERLPLHYQTPLQGKDSQPQGIAVFMIHEQLIREKNHDLLLDLLTIIAVSLLFSFEVLVLFFTTVDRAQQPEKYSTESSYQIVRPIAFIFYFADAIPIAFLPLFIKKIYEASPENVLGLSKEVMLGLPISAYWLAVAIFLPIAGYLLGKLPVKRVMYLSASFTILGFILSAFASNLLQLTIFRMISGIGYGGMVISGQTFVVRNTSLEKRTTGFGALMAGFYSGNICAAAIGGVLASRFGFRATLLLGAVTTLFFIIFVFFNLGKEKIKEFVAQEVHAAKPSFRKSLRILKNRSFLAALVFESIPAQITFIGFIFYVCPLYLNSINVSQASIGRFLTGFGLSVIFLGPLVSKFADKWKNERIFMILGNLLIGTILLSFFFFGSLYAVIISIVAIGIGSAMIASTESSYITLVKEVKELGEANVISMFRTLERIGHISAPLIAGSLITYLGYAKSITAIGIINIGGILLFTLLSQNLRSIH